MTVCQHHDIPGSEAACHAMLSMQAIFVLVCASETLSMAQEAHKQYIQMHDQYGISCSERENHQLWLVIGSSNALHSMHLQS